ncbi:molecular chaperone GrpE [Flavonifractor plautii]|nr:molecular chaperone GrpE [Flavonifractor plautii]
MFYAYIFLGAGILILSILFRLAAVFRLTIPLLYALVVPTLLSDWYYAHYTLANVIWYILLAVTVLSWVYSLVRKLSAIMERRARERKRGNFDPAGARGNLNGGGIVHIDDLQD